MTKIDTASHLQFPSLRLFPLAVFLRITFPIFQPRLKCLNICEAVAGKLVSATFTEGYLHTSSLKSVLIGSLKQRTEKSHMLSHELRILVVNMSAEASIKIDEADLIAEIAEAIHDLF